METRDVGKVITNSACFLALDLCSNKWDWFYLLSSLGAETNAITDGIGISKIMAAIETCQRYLYLAWLLRQCSSKKFKMLPRCLRCLENIWHCCQKKYQQPKQMLGCTRLGSLSSEKTNVIDSTSCFATQGTKTRTTAVCYYCNNLRLCQSEHCLKEANIRKSSKRNRL